MSQRRVPDPVDFPSDRIAGPALQQDKWPWESNLSTDQVEFDLRNYGPDAPIGSGTLGRTTQFSNVLPLTSGLTAPSAVSSTVNYLSASTSAPKCFPAEQSIDFFFGTPTSTVNVDVTASFSSPTPKHYSPNQGWSFVVREGGVSHSYTYLGEFSPTFTGQFEATTAAYVSMSGGLTYGRGALFRAQWPYSTSSVRSTSLRRVFGSVSPQITVSPTKNVSWSFASVRLEWDGYDPYWDSVTYWG